MKSGLYRIRGAGRPDDMRVEENGIEMPMEEALYRARGYLLPVDELPWQEDYFSRQRSADSWCSATETAERAARERARDEFRARFRKS